MTGRDLVTAALRLFGAIAPGESVSASEATDGLASINRMIDSWSNENLMIYETEREEFSLIQGTQEYTLGDGGDFDTVRPMSIDIALLRDESVNPAIEYPIEIINEEQWADIRMKSVTSELPLYLYYENSYPLLTLNIYPKPSAANKLVLYSKKPLGQVLTLDSVISLPPGYQRALIYNGAVELCPEYGKEVSQLVFSAAMESKASLKRLNHKPSYLKADDALYDKSNFNILTGGPR